MFIVFQIGVHTPRGVASAVAVTLKKYFPDFMNHKDKLFISTICHELGHGIYTFLSTGEYHLITVWKGDFEVNGRMYIGANTLGGLLSGLAMEALVSNKEKVTLHKGTDLDRAKEIAILTQIREEAQRLMEVLSPYKEKVKAFAERKEQELSGVFNTLLEIGEEDLKEILEQ